MGYRIVFIYLNEISHLSFHRGKPTLSKTWGATVSTLHPTAPSRLVKFYVVTRLKGTRPSFLLLHQLASTTATQQRQHHHPQRSCRRLHRVLSIPATEQHSKSIDHHLLATATWKSFSPMTTITTCTVLPTQMTILPKENSGHEVARHTRSAHSAHLLCSVPPRYTLLARSVCLITHFAHSLAGWLKHIDFDFDALTSFIIDCLCFHLALLAINFI